MGEGDELRGDAQAGELRGHCQWISEGDEGGRSARMCCSVTVRASRMAMGALAAAMATGGGAEISHSWGWGRKAAATGGASTRI